MFVWDNTRTVIVIGLCMFLIMLTMALYRDLRPPFSALWHPNTIGKNVVV